MNMLKIFRSSLMLIFFVALVVSCSKNSENPSGDRNLKNKGIGDKIFTYNPSSKVSAWDNMVKVFTNNMGTQSFAQNNGINFTNGTSVNGDGTLPNFGSGILNVNGVQIPIIFGAYINYEDGYFDIYLLNQIIDLEDDDYPGLSGIIFEIISPSGEEIQPGEYFYSDNYMPFTFPDATVGINTSTPNEEILDVEGGNLVISKSGNTYTLQFSGILENGSSFTGSYSGILFLLEDNF